MADAEQDDTHGESLSEALRGDVDQTELREHNLIAVFRDLETTQEALEDLEQHGVREQHLSILGQPIDDVELDRTAQEPVGGEAGKSIVGGATAGGLAGGLLGALGTLAATAIPGVGIAAGAGALIGFLAGGGAGSTVGAIIGGEAGLRSDASWTQIMDAIKTGGVVLGVHHDDPGLIEDVAGRMRAHNPMAIYRVNSVGQVVGEGDEVSEDRDEADRLDQTDERGDATA